MRDDDHDPSAAADPEPQACKPHLYAGRLEVAREPRSLEAHAYCPYRGTMLRVGDCFACPDCDGLALDAGGKHSYVVCARAERDGVATEAWYDDADVDVPVVSVRTALAARHPGK